MNVYLYLFFGLLKRKLITISVRYTIMQNIKSISIFVTKDCGILEYEDFHNKIQIPRKCFLPEAKCVHDNSTSNLSQIRNPH